MKPAMILAKTVYFYDHDNGFLYRFVPKTLTVRDNRDYAVYRRELMEKNKAGEMDDETMLILSNFPLVKFGCKSYHKTKLTEPPEDDFVPEGLKWGRVIPITEDVYWDLPESFVMNVLEQVFNANPNRKYEFDVLKKIMETAQESISKVMQVPETPSENGSSDSSTKKNSKVTE